MSKELKFRAWDKRHKKMIAPNDGDFIAWHAMSNWRDCLDVMQFTGLQDSEGVDIYEGDIVVEPDGYPFYSDGLCNYRGEVFWSDDHRWAVGLYVVSDRVSGSACGMSLSEYEPLLVIGNIHANPELLEGN